MKQPNSRLYFILLTLLTAGGLMAQSVTIAGTVTGPNGTPLIGATVAETGTTTGTVADLDGAYSLTVSGPEAEVSVTYTGYRTARRKVNNQSSINFVLQEDSETLEQIVVVGYGSQKRSDITGSVTSVGSAELETAVFNTVDQLLQGRAAGVQVTSSNGAPGSGSTIRIRGSNSILAGNGPLYVVDGIPIAGTPNFNPQDISNIEVLKDASATAIYGSRGANGVILVTTKRGTSGKTKISIDANTTTSSVLTQIDVLNGQQYAEFRNEAAVDQGEAAPFDDPAQFAGQGINWQDEIIGSGQRTNIGLNITGGGDNARFFVSGDYLLDQGIVINSNFRRYNARANVDIDALNDRVTFKVGMNLTQREGRNAGFGVGGFPNALGPITNALLSEPLVPSRDFFGETAEKLEFYNPYLEVTEKNNRNFRTSILANFQMDAKITDDLTFTFNGGTNARIDLTEVFTPSTVGAGINARGLATSNTGRSYDLISSAYLNYKKVINGDHSLNFTGGVEYSEFNNYSYNSRVGDFELEILGLEQPNIGTSFFGPGGGRSLAVLQSGFFRANYAYQNKYLLTFTGRADGSSRFAANNKVAYFPSAAIGWRVTEEDFLQDDDAISNLKLRVSYGATGSQSIGSYQSRARYGTGQYPIGNVPALAFIPTSVENPNLSWETTRQFNAGVDFGLWNNRLEIIADYFIKTTVDLLANVPLSQQSGFGGTIDNLGSIENKGVELSINAFIMDRPGFTWNTGLNYTTFKTTVVELGGNGELFGPGIASNFGGNAHIYREGEEFGLFYGYVTDGLIQQSDLDAATESGVPLPAFNNDRVLGHWKFRDLSGPDVVDADGNVTNPSDGRINGLDRQVIGKSNPDFLLGWNNDFTLGNFSLNVFIQGSFGNDILNAIHPVLNSGFLSNQSYKNQTVDWYENRWTPENPTNDPRYPSINSISAPVADFMIEDGTYVRLKNVSLRYRLPVNTETIKSVQFYVTGTNLITLTNYTGFDPEVSSVGSALAPGVDLGVYPRQRAVTLGLTAGF
ncbi:SusC/RagA family TonB-linked outer membrane protein [Neolewinella antarctica]|uniref:TonB-linked SusC/RagA family outer membrane protein n=1 Tax=Neolewinella antarctica TaxID=442734 RepID=A0ABX0XG78_9BACT|nr:TonB-dependent receptor [Neolewinella antarctica]NJC28328.1 TonB-linked SusC/RagA family outer membrane protein [Neolewinella antarctica]